MLHLITGPFHPDLESALVAHVRLLKQGEPLAPVAVIVPSQQLARRVKWLLAVEQGLALLEVHVLTFHQLAVMLIEEGGTQPSDRAAVADGLLREALLRCLVARGVPGSESFRNWGKMRGLWGGLWTTIQDVKEARVDPASVLAAVGEKMVGAEDPERLASLIRLYATVLATDRELRLADPDDLATVAIAQIPSSPFLARMRGVCYYGCYDLTQGQLDLFKALAAACPMSIFFPLRQDVPAYRFAQRFFEAYIQGQGNGTPLSPSLSSQGRGASSESLADEMAPVVRGACRIVSAVGMDDEVSAAAKDILRLIEDQGYDPMSIGLVVRTLDPYLPTIRRVFEENRLPFTCQVGESLMHQPPAKAVIHYVRRGVDVPARAGWGEYVDLFDKLLPASCDLPAWNGDSSSEGVGDDRDGLVQVAIRDCLLGLGKFDVLGEDVSLSDWVECFVRAIERARLPSETRNQPGVQVLDAMDARGLPFRALFVLGLNEKVFPRSIREDALLRDRDREVLARDLGFKIPRKLDGFDEERLLFALLLRAAQERLYLSYQRADRTGRAMAPSGYLLELQREKGLFGAGERERTIMRRPSERWAEWPYEPLLLTPCEMGLCLLVKGGAAVSAWRSLYAEPDLLAQGLGTLHTLESPVTGLTPHDGLVGPVASHWDALVQRGLSPTSLEQYAQCPFRYCAAHVLKLRPMEAPDSVIELDARARGELCHALLRAVYERVAQDGRAIAEILTDNIVMMMKEVAPAVFAAYEAQHEVGYPLLWTLAQEELLWLVEQVLREDLRELRMSGYVPTLFEVEARGRFDSTLPASLQGLAIRGILDRVDVRSEHGRTVIRVVDYKYTALGEPKDRNLATAAMRGMRLQPPLYLLAARTVLGRPAEPESVALYFLGPHRTDGPHGEGVHRSYFEASCWTGETGTQIGRTLAFLLDGIKAGRFFILPGDHCAHCDYAEVCRRQHNPSWWRAREDASRQALDAIHQLKAPHTDKKTPHG